MGLGMEAGAEGWTSLSSTASASPSTTARSTPRPRAPSASAARGACRTSAWTASTEPLCSDVTLTGFHGVRLLAARSAILTFVFGGPVISATRALPGAIRTTLTRASRLAGSCTRASQRLG
jgi:hypothetical protein